MKNGDCQERRAGEFPVSRGWRLVGEQATVFYLARAGEFVRVEGAGISTRGIINHLREIILVKLNKGLFSAQAATNDNVPNIGNRSGNHRQNRMRQVLPLSEQRASFLFGDHRHGVCHGPAGMPVPAQLPPQPVLRQPAVLQLPRASRDLHQIRAVSIRGTAPKFEEFDMANPFVHIELTTQDPEKSKKFYASLFEWQLEEIPGMDYTIINVGEGTGGGMMKNPDPKMPDNWLPYILVADVAVSTRKAQSLGATILKEVTEVENMGWFSIIADPTGAAFGLWQAKPGM
jgi:hypothetical protein